MSKQRMVLVFATWRYPNDWGPKTQSCRFQIKTWNHLRKFLAPQPPQPLEKHALRKVVIPDDSRICAGKKQIQESEASRDLQEGLRLVQAHTSSKQILLPIDGKWWVQHLGYGYNNAIKHPFGMVCTNYIPTLPTLGSFFPPRSRCPSHHSTWGSKSSSRDEGPELKSPSSPIKPTNFLDAHGIIIWKTPAPDSLLPHANWAYQGIVLAKQLAFPSASHTSTSNSMTWSFLIKTADFPWLCKCFPSMGPQLRPCHRMFMDVPCVPPSFTASPRHSVSDSTGSNLLSGIMTSDMTKNWCFLGTSFIFLHLFPMKSVGFLQIFPQSNQSFASRVHHHFPAEHAVWAVYWIYYKIYIYIYICV